MSGKKKVSAFARRATPHVYVTRVDPRCLLRRRQPAPHAVDDRSRDPVHGEAQLHPVFEVEAHEYTMRAAIYGD